MDSHNVGRHAPSIAKALSRIQSRTLVLGLDSDILFPLSEQKLIADAIESARFGVISSTYGHDGFLIEVAQINQEIKQFLK